VESDGRWAPWYVYVVFIVGGNFIKQRFLENTPVAVNVVVTVVLIGGLFLLITAVYRSFFARRRRRR
jgi:RsiW-degrading membrane proteinase PrsW (M82 family)